MINHRDIHLSPIEKASMLSKTMRCRNIVEYYRTEITKIKEGEYSQDVKRFLARKLEMELRQEYKLIEIISELAKAEADNL